MSRIRLFSIFLSSFAVAIFSFYSLFRIAFDKDLCHLFFYWEKYFVAYIAKLKQIVHIRSVLDGGICLTFLYVKSLKIDEKSKIFFTEMYINYIHAASDFVFQIYWNFSSKISFPTLSIDLINLINKSIFCSNKISPSIYSRVKIFIEIKIFNYEILISK